MTRIAHWIVGLISPLLLLQACSAQGSGDGAGEEAQARGAEPLGAFNVLTRSYDNRRTGANLSETTLRAQNVNADQFGKLFQLSVDDQIYAQVLYASSVSVAGQTHNVIYAATVNNSVYAFDADVGGAPLWQRNFNGAGRPPLNTEVANGRTCGGSYYRDFSAKIGIVGTPVIDAATGTLYVVANTVEGSNSNYRLHAVDITSGAERAWSPKLISATVVGTGDAANGAGLISFDPAFHNQRAGLALASGAVYVTFASYCDTRPYHGWVMGFDEASLEPTAVFVATPNGSAGGIWQAGSAPAVDDDGNVYVTTGNGDFDGTSNFGETLLKLAPRTLSVLDYFTPSNYEALNNLDNDFGSAGPSFLPNSKLLINGSKEGRVFLVDGGNLGHMVPGNTQIPQSFQAVDPSARPLATHHIHNQLVLWNAPAGLNLYSWGENDYLRAFRYDAAARSFGTAPFAVGSVLPPLGMPGGTMTLSANGSATGSGILWATMQAQGDANQGTVPSILRAFNAETLALLWESTSPGDDTLTLSKGSPPVVANGKVYVASLSGAISVFGPRSGATPPLANGIYQLRTNTAPGECVDVNGGSTANGANVQQYQCNGSAAQRWQLTNVVNNVYELRGVSSGKCLDVNGGSSLNGANVQQWECNGTLAQHWAIRALGSGRYRLMPQSGAAECLDVDGGSGADGRNVQQWACNGTPAQTFTLGLDSGGTPPIADGVYRILTGTASGQCVDVAGGLAYEGTRIQQLACDGTDEQRWRFRSLGGNLYQVRAAVSDLCLDVSGGTAANGSSIQQWFCNGSNAQVWSVQAMGGAQYHLMPQTGPGSCMDVAGGSGASGAAINQWTCNGTPAQTYSVIAP